LKTINPIGSQCCSHVVIQALPDLTTTEPLDPTNFVFFKGLNNEAQGDILSQDVSDGLDAGFYRICSINSASNHQPVITPIAQRGSLDGACALSEENRCF
jgi:hypothetical protein